MSQPATSHLQNFEKAMQVLLFKNVPWYLTKSEFKKCLMGHVQNAQFQNLNFVKTSQGCATGDVFLETEDLDTYAQFLSLDGKFKINELAKKNKKSPHIRVEKSNFTELELALREHKIPPFDGIVKIRGLPYSTSLEQVSNFLADFHFYDIYAPLKTDGKFLGKVFVQFYSKDEACRAISRLHGKNYFDSGRYVECFKSSNFERRWAYICEAQFKFEELDDDKQAGEGQVWGGLKLQTAVRRKRKYDYYPLKISRPYINPKFRSLEKK